MLTDSVPGENPLLRLDSCSLTASSRGLSLGPMERGREKELPGASSCKDTNPILNEFLSSPISMYIHMAGVRATTCEFCGDANIQSRTLSIQDKPSHIFPKMRAAETLSMKGGFIGPVVQPHMQSI